MNEKRRYPQIPATVWWGVRTVLNKTPRVAVDARLLGIELGVQETAAKQYINELKAVGILDEECKATSLAHKWRMDETYSEAARKIIEAAYPEQLLHFSPAENPDRKKVVAWFQREGFGHGAALNKAATYLLLGSPEPEASPARASKGGAKPASKQQSKSDSSTRLVKVGSAGVAKATQRQHQHPERGGVSPSLNVNVQIHISADATPDQIESIFSAMKRYLYDADETA